MKTLILIFLIAIPAWADEGEPALALPVQDTQNMDPQSAPVTEPKAEERAVVEEAPVAAEPTAPEADEAVVPEKSADAQKEGPIQNDEAASLSTDTAASVATDPAALAHPAAAPQPVEVPPPVAAAPAAPVVDYGPSAEEGYGVVELKNGGHIMQVDHDDTPNLVDESKEKKADMTSAGKDTSL